MRENERGRALSHILRLRDVLARHEVTVRVPMLVLASADWAASGASDHRDDARRWVEAIARLEDIDASLRAKARRLLAREFGSAGADERETSRSLREIEREVVAFLASVAQRPKPH